MGKGLSKMIRNLFGKKQFRVLLLGLDAAGKTTILNRLARPSDPVQQTVPTVGFNVEKIKVENLKFVVWDVSGQDRLRPFWRHYYRGTAGIIFVVDSSDKQRFELAKNELHNILREEELQYACLLVLANKQDLHDAAEVEKVQEALDLATIKGKEWTVLPTIARTGSGLPEGLEWLSQTMEEI